MQTRHGVVIAGAGLAAQRCCAALRAGGYDGTIRVVGAEPHLPYDRPPLSKAFLAGEQAELALRPAAWYSEHGIDLLLGRRAARLRPRERTLELAGGERLRYDNLVVATGAEPARLPLLDGRGGVHVLRTVDDAERLRRALWHARRLAVVGAGWVGLEVAATARRLGGEVALIEAAPRPLAAVLPAAIGRWVARLHGLAGVDLRLGVTVERAVGAGRVRALELSDGARLTCDAVLVAIGARPATAWLGDGADAPGVHVAGDAAAAGGHWESAAFDGAACASAILGLPPRPRPVHAFWSDQHGVRLQVLGDAGPAAEVQHEPWGESFSTLLLDGTRPAGAVVAGRPREVPAFRKQLQEAA